MWSVYILQSVKYKKYYIGHTEDLSKRIDEHNSGKTKSIKAFTPYELVHTEEYDSKNEAYKRELQIKKYKGGNAFKKLVL